MNTPSDKDLQQSAHRLGQALLERKYRLATVESCTGGWVSKIITDIPGSSHWFDRGFIVYSNHAKLEMLGLSKDCLQTHGAVSQEVVEQLVKGALQNSPAKVALAISGIAGPAGGSTPKPVGTVCFAWGIEQAISSVQRRFHGDREHVRRGSVFVALEELRKLLEVAPSVRQEH